MCHSRNAHLQTAKQIVKPKSSPDSRVTVRKGTAMRQHQRAREWRQRSSEEDQLCWEGKRTSNERECRPFRPPKSSPPCLLEATSVELTQMFPDCQNFLSGNALPVASHPHLGLVPWSQQLRVPIREGYLRMAWSSQQRYLNSSVFTPNRHCSASLGATAVAVPYLHENQKKYQAVSGALRKTLCSQNLCGEAVGEPTSWVSLNHEHLLKMFFHKLFIKYAIWLVCGVVPLPVWLDAFKRNGFMIPLLMNPRRKCQTKKRPQLAVSDFSRNVSTDQLRPATSFAIYTLPASLWLLTSATMPGTKVYVVFLLWNRCSISQNLLMFCHLSSLYLASPTQLAYQQKHQPEITGHGRPWPGKTGKKKRLMPSTLLPMSAHFFRSHLGPCSHHWGKIRLTLGSGAFWSSTHAETGSGFCRWKAIFMSIASPTEVLLHADQLEPKSANH